MHCRSIAAAAAGCLVLSALAAGAQTVTSQRPETMVTALQNLGYRAQVDTSSDGDPLIISTIEGINYGFFFYGCTGGTDCEVVVLSASFSMQEPPRLDALTDWNRRQLIGTASLDAEGDPGIDHPVVMRGGISAEAFDELIQRWGWAIRDFTRHIGFN